MSEEEQEQPTSKGQEIASRIFSIVLVVLGVFLVQMFLLKPFVIPSASMRNTLQCGDRILVDRLTGRWVDYQRGDIVVFHPPREPQMAGTYLTEQQLLELSNKNGKIDKAYVKRLIGEPGDEIELKKGKLYVNGKKSKESYLHKDSDLSDFGPVIVPRNHYLMLGDNRAWSADGRVFGYLPHENIIGKARWVYWPPNHIGNAGTGSRSSDNPDDGSTC